MPQHILVIAEPAGERFRKASLEALSEGKRLAGQANGTLSALVIGSGISDMAGELKEYGADRIFIGDDASLSEYLPDTYLKLTTDLISRENVSTVLVASTAQGKDLSARLAAKTNAAFAMDCVGIRADGDNLIVTRPMFGGKVLAEVALGGEIRIAVIRPNSMELEKTEGEGKIEAIDVSAVSSKYTIVDKTLSTGKVDLTEADIVVTGGRGMGSADYSVIEELADLLGAAVGASRSAVDEGWRPHSDQVGQTGKVVSPNLYLACGVSGAIQHLAGMSSSRVIAAINKDPEAPIFSKSDYGIVGDLFDLVPLITKEIRKLKG